MSRDGSIRDSPVPFMITTHMLLLVDGTYVGSYAEGGLEAILSTLICAAIVEENTQADLYIRVHFAPTVLFTGEVEECFSDLFMRVPGRPR